MFRNLKFVHGLVVMSFMAPAEVSAGGVFSRLDSSKEAPDLIATQGAPLHRPGPSSKIITVIGLNLYKLAANFSEFFYETRAVAQFC